VGPGGLILSRPDFFQPVRNLPLLLAVPMLFAFTHIEFAYSGSHGEGQHIWVPERVITGEEYEGIIVLDKAGGKALILSSSDPSVIQVPKSVLVGPHSNHGIFQIKPLKEGVAQITAMIDGKAISTETSVYSSSRQPEGIKIVLAANSTKAKDITGYVLSVNSRGQPAPVLKNTTVVISAAPLIEVEPSKTTIKQGQYHAKFFAKIKGSGKIHASSEGLGVAEHHISKFHDDVTVKIAVAPNIMMENSRAFVFVWLEKSGLPYKPPHLVYAHVSSSNLKSVRFNENPLILQYGDAILRIPLVDGVGRGYAISQEPGISIVTASIDAIGSDQANVVVGPVLVDGDFEFVEQDRAGKMERAESQIPNVAALWIYPSTTDARAYGVIGLYNANFTTSSATTMTQNNTEILITKTASSVVPVPIDGRIVTLSSSSGLGHPAVIPLLESNAVLLSRGIGSTHAVLFDVLGQSQGNHTVSISGPGLEQHRTAVTVAPPFRESYKIRTVQIPSILGVAGDLAMISVVDDSGALVDAHKALSGNWFAVTSDGMGEQVKVLHNSAVYSGTPEGTFRITISAEGLAPVEEAVIPSGIASHARFDAPRTVHMTEWFPFAIHETDTYGVPIRKTSAADLSAGSDVEVKDGRMLIRSAGREAIGIVTESGASSAEIESFANRFKISAVPSGVTNRIEKEFQIEIVGDVDGFEVSVDSPFPYKNKGGNVFLISPDRIGGHNITFVASKHGYMPAKTEFWVSAEKFVSLTIRAESGNGSELSMPHAVMLGNTSRSVVTPFREDLRPQLLQTEFPSDFVIGTTGYRLHHISFDGQKTGESRISNIFLGRDTEIVATYDRMVKVEAANADGSGFYRYGEQVELRPVTNDRLWFFVREVFDHWEGINQTSERATFTATKDVRAIAVLRDDYTVLMLAVAASVSLFFYANFVRRQGISLSFYLDRYGMLDGIREARGVFGKKLRRRGKESSGADF